MPKTTITVYDGNNMEYNSFHIDARIGCSTINAAIHKTLQKLGLVQIQGTYYDRKEINYDTERNL